MISCLVGNIGGPLAKLDLKQLLLHGQSGRVISGRLEIEQSPSGRFSWVHRIVQERSRLPRSKRHFELIQSLGDSFASRLEVGFLARPAIKKALSLLLLRQRQYVGRFCRAEKALDDLLHSGDRTNALDVNPDLSATRDRVKSQIVGMRQIKMNLQRCREGRFSLRVVAECKFARFDVEVAAEDRPQKASSNNEPPPVSFKMKSRRALTFVLGKSLSQLSAIGWRLIESSTPNVDFVIGQKRV